MAGVKYDAHYSVVGIDPLEVVRFIKKEHPDVIFDKPKKGFFSQLVKSGYPTRQARWCCSLLKEKGGENRFVITGVRAVESIKRNNRKKVEFCYKSSGKKYFNLIIDWTDGDVWDFIKEKNIAYCSLYNEGFKRIGCVLCPQNRDRLKHVERFPRMVNAWKAAFRQRYKYCQERRLNSAKRFKSAEDMFNFWLYDNDNSREMPDQTVMFE